MQHKLEVDVHAHWSDIPPIYRLYVNDEMLTERTFGWISHQYYLTEHLYCNLDTGVHTLKLEYLNSESTFELDAFKVNHTPVNKNLKKSSGNKIEWQFIVDLLNQNNHNNHITLKLDTISKPTLSPKTTHTVLPAQQKTYQTNLALVQRMRELNNRVAKK